MNFLPILHSSSILPSLTFLLRAHELRAPCKTWIAIEFLSYLHDELFSRWPISCWKKVGRTSSQGMVELLPSFGLLFAYSYVKFRWCVSISPGYKSFFKICLHSHVEKPCEVQLVSVLEFRLVCIWFCAKNKRKIEHACDLT